jgi:ferritin-like protein
MTYLPMLDELDRDGAIQEAAEKVDADTRGAFLKKAGIGVGAVAAASAFGGALPSIARGAAVPASDISILNFALTLEYLEAEFYAKAVAGNALTAETKRFADVVAQHEASHVKFLQKVLGAKAVKKPTFDFKGTTDDQAKFQATADVLENTGVHAYLGQLGNIKSKAVLGPAGQIALVEARHAAWIRTIRFQGGTSVATTPAPAGFESGFSKAKILAAVKGTGFIVA